MKKYLPVVMISLALCLAVGCVLEVVVAQQVGGGYQEAPKADPATVAAANFAVTEQQQKQGGSVTLVSVKRAETQLKDRLSGVDYRLCLKVKAGGKTQTVTAIVNKALDGKHSLTSWEPGGCKKAPKAKPSDKAKPSEGNKNVSGNKS